jgi:hypothetical protein
MSEGTLIYKRMTEIMKAAGAIGKNGQNKQQGFKFRGIDDVYNTLHNILADNKVFTTPEVLETHHEERKTKSGSVLIYRIYKIKYTFWTDDGSSVSCTVVGEGMDSGDKAGNKAMSIAHKYALLQVFAIPTEDMVDPDEESHEVEPVETSPRDEVIAEIRQVCKEKHLPKDKLAELKEDIDESDLERLENIKAALVEDRYFTIPA